MLGQLLASTGDASWDGYHDLGRSAAPATPVSTTPVPGKALVTPIKHSPLVRRSVTKSAGAKKQVTVGGIRLSGQRHRRISGAGESTDGDNYSGSEVFPEAEPAASEE